MFHVDLAPRRARRDISVPLLLTRIPFSVLQEVLCSVHAAGAVPQLWRRLCAVKVKLTIALGIGARLARVRSLECFAGFLKGSREVATRAASNSLVIARGRGGDAPRARRGKDQHRRGRAFSEPSLFASALDSSPLVPCSDEVLPRRQTHHCRTIRPGSRLAPKRHFAGAAASGASKCLERLLAGCNA